MIRRSIIWTGSILFITLVIGLSCSRSTPALRIAAHPWPGYEFLFLANADGLLDNRLVVLKETRSASESLQALLKDEVDAAALTLDEVLLAMTAGTPLQVVLIFNESAGADVLLTQKDIGTLSELRGKRIGVEGGTVGTIILQKILQQVGMTEADVHTVELSAELHQSSWMERQLDALITYEPHATRILSASTTTHRLWDSRSLPGTIFDVLAIRSDRIAAHQEALRALTGAHFLTLQKLYDNPQNTAYRLATHLGLTGQEVMAVYRGVKLPGIAANRTALQPGGGLDAATARLSATMLSLGLLPDSESPAGISDARYLPSKD